jgi:1-acyl-sn-glycerol-3-phosphate acyltransferase
VTKSRKRQPVTAVPLGPAARLLYRVLRVVGVGLTRALWRVRVEGVDRLPTSVPYVVAPVHRSYVDFLIVGVSVPRVLRYMVKDSIWSWPRLGRFIERLGSFPVDRELADREALRNADTAIADGDPVVMFPEGRRKEGPYLQDLHHGPAWVACRNRIPLVPVAIGGSDAAMPIGKKMIRPARVRVVIGEPIYPDAPPSGRVPRQVVRETTERLRAELQALYDGVR